jgi:hypothetical protein
MVSTGGSSLFNFGAGGRGKVFFGVRRPASAGSAATGLGGAAASSSSASNRLFGGSAASTATVTGGNRIFSGLPFYFGDDFSGFQGFKNFGRGHVTATWAVASGNDGAATASATSESGPSFGFRGRIPGRLATFTGRFPAPTGGFPEVRRRFSSYTSGFPRETFPTGDIPPEDTSPVTFPQDTIPIAIPGGFSPSFIPINTNADPAFNSPTVSGDFPEVIEFIPAMTG